MNFVNYINKTINCL